MSAQTAGPETLGHLSDPPQNEDPNSKRAKAITGKSPMQIAIGRLRRDKIAMVCFFVVVFFVLVALLDPWLKSLFGVNSDDVLPSQFLNLDGLPKKGPPNGGFDPDHPFGVAPRTAVDNLAYWLDGCRNSLEVATIATVFASLLGIALGLISGFAGGLLDRALSFITDFFLTIPFLLAALSLSPIISERFAVNGGATVFGAHFSYQTIQVTALIAILGGFGWMGVCRLIRGEVLSLREREFVMAARVLGMPTRRILIRELLPNLAAPIVVSISLMLPAFVAAEAGLAFLGIGVTTRPSWGRIIEAATSFFDTYPLYLWEPLIGIVAVVLALNLLGDAIRDAMDPKTRR
jgi:ABC-type dipeptide/oligopeptide/nickel transport system permease subunit